MESNSEKVLLVVSALDFSQSHNAGVVRMKAYSFAMEHAGVKTYLCTGSKGELNIHEERNNKQTINYLCSKGKHSGFRLYSNVLNYFIYYYKLMNFIKLNFNKKNIVFLVYPSSNYFYDFFASFILKKIYKQRVFCEMNELRSSYVQNRANGSVLKKIKNRMDQICFKINDKQTRHYDGLICITTSLFDYFKRSENKIIIPALCLYDDSNKFKGGFYTPGLPFKIAFTGTINYKKDGIGVLIDAVKNLSAKNKDIELHFYGYGDKSEVEQLVKTVSAFESIMIKVYYHGSVSNEEIRSLLPTFNLLVLPRPNSLQAKYGFSTKLAEYLNSGTPTLVTNVGDNLFYIKDGVNGFVIDELSIINLEKKISEIILNYNSIVIQISEEAKRTASVSFNPLTYSKKLSEFLFNDKKNS